MNIGTMRIKNIARAFTKMSLKLHTTLTCIQIFTFITASRLGVAGIVTQFQLLTNPYLKFVPLGVELAGADLFTCARQCVLRNNSCFSFVFNEHLNTCSLGSWPTSSPVAISHVNTYRNTQPCNTAANFTLQQSGDVRVCVRMSPDTLNYTDAREVCKAFGASLYTLKTPDKVTIMKAVGKTYNFWVGLDDMQKEDEFRWVDDGSVLPYSWRLEIFNAGEPGGGTSENCAVFAQKTRPLIDARCLTLYRYLCEMAQIPV